MTNADKYLKDEVNIYDFLVNYSKWYVDKHHRLVVTTPLEDFLRDECKQILSEDEKVILRSLPKRFTHIGRGFVANDEEANGLYLKCNTHVEYNIDYLYHDLFQFIKSYQEYKISDLLGDE